MSDTRAIFYATWVVFLEKLLTSPNNNSHRRALGQIVRTVPHCHHM